MLFKKLIIQKNGTSSGVYEVEDGHSEDGESLGKIIKWNNAVNLVGLIFDNTTALLVQIF